MALGANFQVGSYAKKLSETVLREARAEHDLLINGGKKRDAPSTPSTVDAGAGKNVRKKFVCFLNELVDAVRVSVCQCKWLQTAATAEVLQLWSLRPHGESVPKEKKVLSRRGRDVPRGLH